MNSRLIPRKNTHSLGLSQYLATENIRKPRSFLKN
nr:MAG TPA: hypothetical protein [Bacteriophage sp.]